MIQPADTPRDLLTSIVLDDDFFKKLHAVVDQWHAMPESARERLMAFAESAVARQKESRRRAPEPPDDEPGEVPVILV